MSLDPTKTLADTLSDCVQLTTEFTNLDREINNVNHDIRADNIVNLKLKYDTLRTVSERCNDIRRDSGLMLYYIKSEIRSRNVEIFRDIDPIVRAHYEYKGIKLIPIKPILGASNWKLSIYVCKFP